MLCAQHALSALLQHPYFTTPDLASIANSLDVAESSARGHDRAAWARRGAAELNYDDTGLYVRVSS